MTKDGRKKGKRRKESGGASCSGGPGCPEASGDSPVRRGLGAKGPARPLVGRDTDAGVPGGWNEVAEIEDMRREAGILLEVEKEEKAAWRG